MNRITVTLLALVLTACASEADLREELHAAGYQSVDVTRTSPFHLEYTARNRNGLYCTGSWEQVGPDRTYTWKCGGDADIPTLTCDALHPRDCMVTAERLWDRGERTAAAVDAELACLSGVTLGCDQISRISFVGDRAALVGCGQGSAESCHQAAHHAEDPRVAHALHSHACANGSGSACSDLVREAYEARDEEAFRHWSAKACALGVTAACLKPRG